MMTFPGPNSPFLTICILSYNRPREIARLLDSIDLDPCCNYNVLIVDDFSPRNSEISAIVDLYRNTKIPHIKLITHPQNCGYDTTLTTLTERATGEWIIYMGDDDEFVAGSLKKLIAFLNDNDNLHYILKSHYLIHPDGSRELFRYFKGDTYFQAGSDSYMTLFRRSVYIAGFIIRAQSARQFITHRFRSTMLMQLYYLAEVVLRFDSAYWDTPLTQQYSSHSHNEGEFMYDRDRSLFVERKPTPEISYKFLKSFSEITSYIDKKYNLSSTASIKHDMSKYFYPSLAIYRSEGVFFFLAYVYNLIRIGFGSSFYFYLYVLALLLLGKPTCDRIIFTIKHHLGYTPHL